MKLKRPLPSSFYAFIFFLPALIFPTHTNAQSENPWSKPPEIEISGFADVFYAYDFNEPDTNIRQSFFFHYNRHNEFNLNLGYIGIGVQQTKYRASIKLQAGTYPIDNYIAENEVMKHIFEAYAGISLTRKNNLWLDVGIFPSHLGFESAISIDNWTLTRSLVAESSPYFLSGAKLTYTPSDKITILGVITDGWQRIKRVVGNSFPSFGTQLLITPNENYTINWSTFVGTEDPDSTRRMRYFNNLFAQMQFVEHFGLIAGIDFGFQQKSKGSNDYDNWYGITLIAHVTFAKRWAAALRGEYYHDENNVIVIIPDSPYGFKTTGLSLNLDFIPVPQVACRVESRWLHSPDQIYTKGDTWIQDNFFIVASIAVKMSKKFLEN
jgi:hypothetical protein